MDGRRPTPDEIPATILKVGFRDVVYTLLRTCVLGYEVLVALVLCCIRVVVVYRTGYLS